MSGELAPKPRIVLCPKCRQLLPEHPNYDVYKCGGCGTILQAKKRKNKAVNSESSSHETDTASRNALNLVSGEYSNGEQPISHQENVLRDNIISSSSGDCPLEGNGGRGQIENGEYNGEHPLTTQGNGFRTELTSSSSGDCSLEGNSENGQIENGECNGEQLVTSQENSLSQKTTSSSTRECSLNGSGGREQIKNGKCNGEKLVISQDNGLREKATSSSSGECFLDGNGGRGSIEDSECYDKKPVISQDHDMREKATSSSSGERFLNGNDGRGQIDNGKCNGEQLGPVNLSDEELENVMDISKLSDIRRHTLSNKGYSNGLPHCDSEASAELMANNSVEKANDINLQLKGEDLSNGNVPLEQAEKHLISALGTEDASDDKSALVAVKSEVDIAGSELEVAEELNNGNLFQEGAENKLISGSDGECVNNDKLALVADSPEADTNGTNEAESIELINRNLLLQGTEEEMNVCASDGEDPKDGQSALKGEKSEVDISRDASTAKRLSAENLVSEKGSFSCVSLSNCNLKEGTSDNHVSSPQNIHHSFDHIRSAVTFDNTDVHNPSLEISGALGELSKSPTTKSSHAYDGSVSSNDGADEQFLGQNLYSFENTYTVANGSEAGSRKGKGLVSSMLYGDLETQHQSYLPNRKYHVMTASRGNQNELLETTRHGHAYSMRTKKDESPFKIPLHRSGSQSGYESGSPSNQMYDELYCSSSYVSPDFIEDPDQEKIKLLRMVYKLQDQLNRTSYANRETTERLSSLKHAYQRHESHEGRFYHGLDCPRWDASCSHGINWRQRHNISRIPYSAEQTSSPHHVDDPCFHCYPQEWQCSGEFPPHVLYQHEDLHRPRLGHSCCLSHHSYPSNPQRLMTSKLVHDRGTKSCDQRQMVPEMNYIREKPSLTKRHYRPVAGGAPFVTCYKCLKLLQLPADFLLFKRECHQLKCGTCKEVLKFSLQNRSHIVSYAPNALVPPSSDVDVQNKVIDGSNSHSHAVDPVSYSDDYGHSISKSYSSEGDAVYVAHDNPSVSPGTIEPIIEKEKIASRGPSTSKAPVETDELAVHSSNMSSETVAVARRLLPKSSPLHQLMGYASPSQVIRGTPPSVEGKEAMLNGEH